MRHRSWHDEIFEAMFTDGSTQKGKCEHCEHEGDLVECDSRRMDSDRVWKLCIYCATEHHEYWDDMWDEYWAGRL